MKCNAETLLSLIGFLLPAGVAPAQGRTFKGPFRVVTGGILLDGTVNNKPAAPVFFSGFAGVVELEE